MSSIKELINDINEADKGGPADKDYMQDEDYRESCFEVINEALQKGFDVIHMENGDIITTGTKIIVTQYRWDSAKRKLAKISSKQKNND
jgi:hypothetical protein